MSSTTATSAPHPIADFARRLHGVLDRLSDTAAWSMSTAEQRSVLVEVTRAQARLEELRLRVLAAGDRADIAAQDAATSTGAWLAHATRTPRGAAQADVTLALSLDTDFETTRAALAAGHLDPDQARVIVRAVRALPDDVPGSVVHQAEKHLVDLAASHDAIALKHLARHLHEALDPDAADEALGRKLEAEERAAARATFLQLYDNGDGTHTGRFKISALHAAMLKKALDALTNPRRAATGETDGLPPRERPRRARPELQGQAFCELLERLDPQRLPMTGGVNATVVIMLDFERLLSGLGTATLDTGERISAGLARRLACGAGIIPAVVRRLVDGTSAVLDLGRTRRLHTEAQRIALAIEQGGCTADGCDRPAGWCQAHHDVPWSQGGGTSVTNGRLLCGYHHGKAHSLGYDTEALPGNKVRFHRRT